MEPYYTDGATTLYEGDCLDILPSFPEASVDSIVTDPPYGLGFMGKAWDVLPPGEEWARECLRVLKPGGHLLAFGGTRTWHRLAVAVEDAGFEIRDSIAWMHGQGFPKGKANLKPAFEPVVVARKPLSGTVAGNVLAHGTGALNIAGCRIEGQAQPFGNGTKRTAGIMGESEPRGAWEATAAGRWPANVVLDESQATALDEQTRDMRAAKASAGNIGGQGSNGTVYGDFDLTRAITRGAGYVDSGGASRFFYVPKASKRERPTVDGIAHPTVKPLALMRWLVRLVTPPGGVVLDPFAGSGTTIEAALLEGMNPIGIEWEAEYLPLIHARIARTAARDPELFDGGAA